MKKYPEMMKNLTWGIETNWDGWLPLIDSLCEHLRDGPEEHIPIIEQIKEKFGGLRFYVDSATDKQFAKIRFAQELSFKICEKCSSMKDVTVRPLEGNIWILTLCDNCRQQAKTENNEQTKIEVGNQENKE